MIISTRITQKKNFTIWIINKKQKIMNEAQMLMMLAASVLSMDEIIDKIGDAVKDYIENPTEENLNFVQYAISLMSAKILVDRVGSPFKAYETLQEVEMPDLPKKTAADDNDGMYAGISVSKDLN